MSLINQMLQDLEQRSVGNPVATGLHGQIRAVQERRTIHPAWWLVLLLSLLLIGAAAWYFTRPVPAPQAAPNLALKIAPDLSTLPSPAAQAPLPLDPVPAAAPAPAPAAASVAPVAPAPAEPAKPVTRIEPLHEPVAVAERPIVLKEDLLRQSAPAADIKPVNLSKQVKELTPQQQSENEFGKANALIHAGRANDAMPSLELALKLDPHNVAARQTLIGLLLQNKRGGDAVRLAQEGLALDPGLPGLNMILARVQLDQGDLQAALATMEHGLPSAGAHAEYHAFLAALLMRDKRNKEAIEQYTIALTAAPQTGVWWMGLGLALQAENHAPEAREAYIRAKGSNSLTPELQAFVEQKLAALPKS